MEKQWLPLLKSGCHLSLLQRFDIVYFSKTFFFFFFFKILLSDMISYSFTGMVGEWVDVLWVVQGDDGAPRAKGLKWWWGRVGSRETNTLQAVPDQFQLPADVTLCCHTSGWLTQISVFTQEHGWAVPNWAEKENRQLSVWLGGRHTSPQQLQLSRCTPLLFPAQGSGSIVHRTHRPC